MVEVNRPPQAPVSTSVAARVVAEEVRPAPAPVAPTAANGSQDGEADHEEDLPTCCICQDHMRRGDDTMALWCTHAFHRACVLDWRQCANKTEMDCPYRCVPPHALEPECLG